MNTNKPLVSVIIPAYNHEEYVQETIKSIIQQTYQNIELLIIDDGSQDSTWQKIQEMESASVKRFTNVYFKTQQNSGTCTTLNNLIQASKGEYIFIIASDDIVKPETIKEELEFLSQNPNYALCVGKNEIIDSESKLCYWDKDRNIVYDKTLAKYTTYDEYLEKTTGIKLTGKEFGKYHKLLWGYHIPNGYLIRRTIFEVIGLFSISDPLEDYWLVLQISKYAKMKFINKVFFSYRWHNTNTVKNGNKIQNFTEITQKNENQRLTNLKLDKALPYMKKIFKKGILYKKQGIPYILELCTYNYRGEKIKRIKVLNITILEYKKVK